MSSKTLEKILIFGLPVGLAVPLFIEKHFLFPFVTVKTYFFYILVDILFCCYLLLLTKKKLYPAKNKLLYFLFGLFAVRFILDIFGINFIRSFWGNYERMFGIYTWVHILLFLWMILSVYNSREKYLRLFDVSVFVSLLVSFYGLCQKFGWHFWFVLETGDQRIASTIGNASFLAGYLLLNIFFALYLFYRKKNSSWRVFYGLVIMVNLFVLFSTATRGAVIGLFAALLAMLLSVLVFYGNKKAKLASGIVLLTVVLSAFLVFALKDTSLIQNNFTLRRISQMSLSEGTGKSRVQLWGMSWRAAQDRLLLGYGENNLFTPLDKYHDFELNEDWVDSSHNQFLDELLSHGLIGLLIYLLFLWYVLKRIFREREKDFWLFVIFLGLLVAYLVQGLLVFDTLAIILMFILFLGFLCLGEEGVFDKILSGFTAKLSVIVIVVLAVFVCINTIPPMVMVVVGQRYVKVDIEKTTEMFREAEERAWFGYDNLAPLMAENALVALENPGRYTLEQLKAYMSVVDDTYQKAIATSNNYSKFYINLAKILQTAQMVDPAYIDRSIDLLKQAREYSPRRIDLYYALAQGYFYKDDIVSAENSLKEALVLNIRPGEVYLSLAEVQFRKGDPESAFESLEMAEQFGREIPLERWERFAKILTDRARWQDALRVFLAMDSLNPGDVNTYFNIALTYKKMGNREKSREFILKILDVDPGMEGMVNEFLQTL